ncbi:MAG: STAS domain-containing protein [Bacteroidetes bacterium]|nr:STAS domain-containing protein [Bacteroidota bacterium]
MESITTNIFSSGNYTMSFSGNFKKERHENILIEIITAKEIDFKKAMYFKDILDEDISEGYNNILVDLSDCDFIESSFLGILVQASKKLKINNGNLKIIGLNALPDNIFILGGFTKLFQVFKTRQEAIQSFAA